ncbi:hypothetical protein AAC387_Pa05g0133 [Persea americana]
MSMAAAQEEEGTSEEMALLVSSLESMGMAAVQEEEEGTSEKMAALEEEGTSEEIAAQEEEEEGTCDEERTSEEFAAQEEEEGTSEEIEPDYERSDLPMWERHEKWMASFRRVYKDEAEKARQLNV